MAKTLDIVISIVLLAIALPISGIGVSGVVQGSVSGAAMLTFGCVLFGLSCIGPLRLKSYFKSR